MISKEALHRKTSQEITALLYEALLDHLEEALASSNKTDYHSTNLHLQKANNILERLGAGLNYEAGIIADQLETLYQYASSLVVEANLTKDSDKIIEVIAIIESISIAWKEAIETNDDHQHIRVKRQTQAYESQATYQS
ncbi:flagellar export chaperone FliS [Alteribacter aurantiacus]|uniref:flagellar export chaperone FliS n=1 Tax=Alteribacter aurantiacus TaxID=254410 RepID=UPI00040BD99C|nr:flagellar export chaperone FliS [Alteribacter aurantiacus]